MARKIVIASDSFKGSLSSIQVACSCERAILDLYPSCEVVKLAVADGGEGTVEALTASLGGRFVETTVSDPLGRKIPARYGMADGTAIMEMSAASGLTLVEASLRNPMLASSYGTGEMILDALEKGCRSFLVGIGGSATNDAGTGMLEALGVRFLDSEGHLLHGMGGNLELIADMDLSGLDTRLEECRIVIACDVDTPFCGKDGAAFVFAPQKGASPDQLEHLDRGLENIASLVEEKLGVDVRDLPGAGAAGGLGGACRAFLHAELKRGVDMVLDAVDFDSAIKDADLVITGEGRIDGQTSKGKTPFGVLLRAKRAGVPVLAIAGKVADLDRVEGMGFDTVSAVSEGLPLEMAMRPEVACERIRRSVTELLESISRQSS